MIDECRLMVVPIVLGDAPSGSSLERRGAHSHSQALSPSRTGSWSIPTGGRSRRPDRETRR
jgi:hypothetical protein